MIRIQGLHKFFNKGRQNEIHVINGVDLDLPESGMVAIFGKSGCGKTTLLNVIGGLDGFAEGTLTIENNDIRRDTDDIRNQYIGYIFQNYNLNKNVSCYENVADALRLCGLDDEGEIEKRVGAALKNVGMEKYSKRTPDTLSGGQQQRIAIARAIVKNPRIILADEPTGNLDEANTVMIMDLLKAISRNHLVLLVTHEANLVDHYCDQVIELSDGRIVNVKSNSSANGFAARDKNDIFLGELERTSLRDGNAEVEYFGEMPETPVKIRIVNNGGKLYVQIGTSQVQIIDEFSEVKLREGVYEEKARVAEIESNIDMSQLSPIQCTKSGRLFTFKSSVKSGYDANFRASRRGKRALRSCMALFASVVVFMSAVFGGSIGDLIEADKAYNHNVFYLCTNDIETSRRLVEAVGNSESGIDYIRLSAQFPNGDSSVFFRAGNFETFSINEYQLNYTTNAVFLGDSLAKDLELVEGERKIETGEILITTAVADALLEKSAFGYIKEYKDIIGLITSSVSVDGKSSRVTGIVESDESAIYLDELSMAKYSMNYLVLSNAYLASSNGVELSPGETVLAIKSYGNGEDYPEVGEKIKIQGVELTVKTVNVYYIGYEDYLKAIRTEKMMEDEFFHALMTSAHPELVSGSDAYEKALADLYEQRYFEYYDYYYAELGDFIRNNAMIEMSDLYHWMYVEKGVEEAKYYMVSSDYFKATRYKASYGRYPSISELDAVKDTLPEFWDHISMSYPEYENEFYNSGYYYGYENCRYYVSDEDYITLSKQLGETHPTATALDNAYVKEAVAYGEDVIVDSNLGDNICYTVIHSSNPAATAAWLGTGFSIEAPNEYWPGLVTPDDVFDDIVRDNMATIITGFVTMAVILVLMSICMYFIMRSSLMNRIKEVGIYRAIGVTKKNLVFKSFIESAVLSLLTVMVGYIISSVFLFVCMSLTPLMEQIFYYPVWLAGIDFIILAALSLICGTLPMLSLLRKTPSEILAKYDI